MLVHPLCGRNVTHLGMTKAKCLINHSSAFNNWEMGNKSERKQAKKTNKVSQEDWEFIKGHLWLEKRRLRKRHSNFCWSSCRDYLALNVKKIWSYSTMAYLLGEPQWFFCEKHWYNLSIRCQLNLVDQWYWYLWMSCIRKYINADNIWGSYFGSQILYQLRH